MFSQLPTSLQNEYPAVPVLPMPCTHSISCSGRSRHSWHTDICSKIRSSSTFLPSLTHVHTSPTPDDFRSLSSKSLAFKTLPRGLLLGDINPRHMAREMCGHFEPTLGGSKNSEPSEHMLCLHHVSHNLEDSNLLRLEWTLRFPSTESCFPTLKGRKSHKSGGR